MQSVGTQHKSSRCKCHMKAAAYQHTLHACLLQLCKQLGVCSGGLLGMLHSSCLVPSNSLLFQGQLRALSPHLCLSCLQGAHLLLHLPVPNTSLLVTCGHARGHCICRLHYLRMGCVHLQLWQRSKTAPEYRLNVTQTGNLTAVEASTSLSVVTSAPCLPAPAYTRFHCKGVLQ